MVIKKIPTIGEIKLDEMDADEDKRKDIIQEFLTNFVKEYAYETAQFINITREVPFVFKGEQMLSILSAVLGRVTNAFIIKPQILSNSVSESGEANTKSDSWVNFLCYYRNTAILLEIRNDLIPITACRIGKKIVCNWSEMGLRLENAEKVLKYHKKYLYPTYKVAIHISTVYQIVEEESELPITDPYVIPGIQRKLAVSLKPKSNWVSQWQLSQNLIGAYSYKSRMEYYLAVLFNAFILKVEGIEVPLSSSTALIPNKESRMCISAGGENVYMKAYKPVYVRVNKAY